MTLGQLIKEYREKNNLSQRQFANISKVSNGYISMLEEGKNPKTQEPIVPSIITMKKLSVALNMTIDELFCSIDDMPVKLSTSTPQTSTIEALGLRPITRKRFPMLGEIACGQPIFANEEHESYIDASSSIDADFCLTAKGDSMINAGIKDGDVVFIKMMEMVNNGDIAAVIIEDEATLKRVYYYPEQNKLLLSPENAKYPPLIFENEQLDTINILGKAVCYMSML